MTRFMKSSLIATAFLITAAMLLSPMAWADVQKVDLEPATAKQKEAWNTSESARANFSLDAVFDSSGPEAWDPKQHSLVYYTSEGMGYSHRPSKTNKLPGVQVIDAYTKKTIAWKLYDLGVKPTRQPHGLGVSPDGQWVYIGFAYTSSSGKDEQPTLIINARTLKLERIISHSKQKLHHIMAFTDWQGRDRVTLQYGFGADGGPHIIVDPKDNNKVVQAITFDEIRPMGHPYIAVDPTGKFMYVSMGSPTIRDAPFHSAAVAKFNMETKAVSVIPEVGYHPIGIVNTADGKFTYVADGHGSHVYKIDNELDKIVADTSAGVAGPYGLRLNRDESKLFVMGKGEGSHNTGGVVGVIDTKLFNPSRDIDQPIQAGGSIIDHGTLHPDPKVNELWISSAGTFDTIVLNLDSMKVTERISTPNKGDTHSGSFVRYDGKFNGVVLADHSGPTGPEGWAAVKKYVAAK